jgi:hypothetical protein
MSSNSFFCLVPDDLTCQRDSILDIEPQCAPTCPTYFFTCLTPDDFTRQWGSSTT